MKEVEKRDPHDTGKMDIPDVSGGRSYIDDSYLPIPIGPGFPENDYPPAPGCPRVPGDRIEPIPGPPATFKA